MSDDKLEIGSVIYEFVTDTIPPKKKFYIIVGRTSDNLLLSTVYINSNIYEKRFPTEELKKLHVKISASNNTFLDYDSYVDCSRMQQKKYDNVKKCVDDGGEFGYYNSLIPEELQEIISTIKSAPTINNYTKKRFGFI